MDWTQVAPPGAPRELPKAKVRQKKWWNSSSNPPEVECPKKGGQIEEIQY